MASPLGQIYAEPRAHGASRFLIFLILAIGFSLRVWGIHFGLPELYHADEPIVVNHALAYGSWDFHPHFFRIPPLVSYLLFGVYGLCFLTGKTFGVFSSIQDFEYLFYRDPTSFYLIARIIFGAILGTASIYALYRLCLSFFLQSIAIAAAFLLSVCFLHVSESHYVYADIPLVLVLILAFYPIFKILEKNEIKQHFWAGLAMGVSVAVKYNGGAIIIPYLVASFFSFKKEITFKGLVTFAVTAFFIYACLNPYSLLDFNYFIKEVRAESGVHPGFSFLFPLTYVLPAGMGYPLMAAALIGSLDSYFNRDKKRLVLLSFIVSYYAVICLFGQPYGRYGLPLIPFLLIFSADAALQFLQRFKVNRWQVFAGILFVLALPTLVQSILFGRLMSQKDTRTLAREWIEEHIPSGAKIALDHVFFTPALNFTTEQLLEKNSRLDSDELPQAKSRKFQYHVTHPRKPAYRQFSLSATPQQDQAIEHSFLFSRSPLPYDLASLQQQGIEYIVTVRARKEDAYENFYSAVAEKSELIAEFNPYRNKNHSWMLEYPLTGGPFQWKDVYRRNRNGAIVRIYRLRSVPAFNFLGPV